MDSKTVMLLISSHGGSSLARATLHRPHLGSTNTSESQYIPTTLAVLMVALARGVAKDLSVT